MLKFILFVHYRVQNALNLNSQCTKRLEYESPGVRKACGTKRLRYETPGTNAWLQKC